MTDKSFKETYVEIVNQIMVLSEPYDRTEFIAVIRELLFRLEIESRVSFIQTITEAKKEKTNEN